MNADLDARVRAAVSAVPDPELRRSLGDLEMVRGVRTDGGHAHVEIALTIVGCPASDRIEREVTEAAAHVPGVDEVTVTLGVMSAEERSALIERLRGAGRTNPFVPGSLTRVIAVTSGKGGVGKSTVTANLAVALAARGLSVGLIDADVHGYSIPSLMGLTTPGGGIVRPTRIDDLIVPPVAYGVKTISIGMFLREGEEGSAVAWRGPMLHRTVQQFLTEVYFGDLDVLLLDMPPGTGDIAISVGQLLPHAEVLVVTTPQPAAADVAVRSGLVAAQTGQSVLGVVENMAAMTLPDGSTIDLFGSGGGAAVAAGLTERLPGDVGEIPLLASIPLSTALRRSGDDGTPMQDEAAGTDPAAQAIGALADRVRQRPRGLAGRSLPLSTR